MQIIFHPVMTPFLFKNKSCVPRDNVVPTLVLTVQSGSKAPQKYRLD